MLFGLLIPGNRPTAAGTVAVTPTPSTGQGTSCCSHHQGPLITSKSKPLSDFLCPLVPLGEGQAGGSVTQSVPLPCWVTLGTLLNFSTSVSLLMKWREKIIVVLGESKELEYMKRQCLLWLSLWL